MKTAMMIQFKRAFLLFVCLLLAACNGSQDEGGEGASAQMKTRPLSKYEQQRASFLEAEAAFTFREEDIDDPSFYDKPRLQFLWWPHFANPSRQSIWSMKIDGTDLARVVSIEWLYEGGWQAAGRTRPVRSPDNRYIAVMQYYDGDPASRLRLIDLKNRTSESITELWGDSSFNWSADSQTLYFRKDSWITSYHLPSKQFKKIYKTYAKLDSTRLIFNKTAFAIPYKSKLKIIDLNGKLLKKIELDKSIGTISSISDDGSVLLVAKWDFKLGRAVYSARSLAEPEKEFSVSSAGHNVIHSPYDKYDIFASSGPSIFNLKSKQYTDLGDSLPDRFGTKVTLYNQIPYTKETK